MDKKTQLAALTGLRFFTAYHIVMFHHGETALAHFPLWLRNILAGPGGVGLFFLLSGFILTYVYGKRFEDKRIGKRDFWLARFARIYPTYVLGLVLTAPFFFPSFFQNNDFVAGFVKLMATVIPTLFLLHAWLPPIALSWNGPDWAVSAMFFYYLLFPFTVILLAKQSIQRVLFLTIGLILLTVVPALTVIEFPVPDDPWQEGLSVLPLTRLPEFLLGLCLGKLYLHHKKLKPDANGNLLALVGTLFTMIVMAVGLELPYYLYKPLLVLSFSTVIYGLALGGGILSWFLSRPLVVSLGHAGFPIYILSLPVWGWCNRVGRAAGIDTSSFLFFAVYSLILIGFALLVLHYYENPLRKVIQKVFPKPSVAVPPASEQAQLS